MNRYILVLLALALVFPAMAFAATNSTHDPLKRHHSQPVAVSEVTVATHKVVVNQFRKKRVSELQTSVRHYRAIARHRAAELGVTIEPRPLPNNIVWLLKRREVWKHRAAHYADRLRAVAAQKAAAAAAAAASTTALAPTSSVPTSSGFPAACVAMAEESGHNSIAGYFGTISPPSAYNVAATSMVSQYGESWLNWPYSAQLVFSEQLFAEYGGSAWGPLTRQKCGI